MDLERARELFSAHEEGELGPEEAAEFEAFLAESAAGRTEYEEFKRAIALVRGLPREPAPPDFLSGVQRKIRSRTKGAYFRVKAARPFYFRVPYELFSLLMILVLGALLVLQALAGAIHPVAEPKVRLQEAVSGPGGGPAGSRRQVQRRVPLQREVIRYRYRLASVSAAVRPQVLELARQFGAEVGDAGATGPLRLLLPRDRFKSFTNKLREGLEIRVERDRRFTATPPAGVEVEILFGP